VKRKLQPLVVLVLFSGLSWRSYAQEAGGQAASLPVVSIAPFEGSKAQVPCWSSAIGQGLSEMLAESLENEDNKFQVLDASEANGQQGGTRLGASGSAGQSAKADKNAAGGSGTSASDTNASASSDFIFYASVAEFSAQTNSSTLGDFISSSPFANFGAKMVSAHVQIDWHLVDAETKRTVTRGTAGGSAHGSEFDMAALSAAGAKTPAGGTAATQVKTAKAPAGANSAAGNLPSSFNNIFGGLSKAWGGSSPAAGGTAKSGGGAVSSSHASQKSGGGGTDEGETIGYDNSAFMDSALGKATAGAVTNIMKQLAAINLPEPGRAAKLKASADALKHTPGKILAVAGKDTIIVSLGSREGFKEGDQLELYETTDVKDDKGNVVFTDEKEVGEITLSEVQDDRSRASYAGDLTVQEGWTVKAK